MKREEVQERLGREMNRILSETAIRPVTEDGRVVGVRLTRVAQDSLLTEAGLRSGDVLTNINGTEIDGMATLISLWPRLQGASDLRAQGLRDGRPFSISLSLQ
jgi:type II secretory pathway component PulC